MQTWWRTLRPYLMLSLLGLVLIWPLFGADVPCTDDGQLYYYQAAVQRYGIEHGLVYSRWMPDAALGYGIPFFNYREPLPRFLPLILHLLGMGVPRALNLVSALTVLAAGWGTYRLTRDLFDSEPAGLVAGAAAMAAPYHLITVYRRGSLPELVALALIPWVVWAFWRSVQNRRAAIGAVAAWAALILSHNISTLLLAPVLGGYAVLLAWLNRKGGDLDLTPFRAAVGGSPSPSPKWRGERSNALERVRSGVRLNGISFQPLLAFIGGLGLAAFFWIPAFFEKGLVQISAATATRNNSYIFNFASLKEIFAAPQPYNPAWLNPSTVFPVGLVAVVLALIGLVGGWLVYEDRTRRAHLIGFAAVGMIYLGMALPASQPIWDAIPTLAFVQFPWRMIGRAALPVAVLAGVGVDAGINLFNQSKARFAPTVFTGIGCLALLITGMPYTYPVSWCPSPPHPTITDVNRFELGLPGLDNESSYFPVGVVPPDDTPLLADYESGITPQRFEMRLVPEQAAIEVNYRPMGAAIHVETDTAFTARYLTYAFPGWQVRIDGQRVDIVPDDANKLITFEVPEGQHKIAIRFGTTPLRAAATVVSILSLAGLIAMLVFSPKGRTTQPTLESPTAFRMVVGAVGLLLIIARLTWPGYVSSPWMARRQPQPNLPISAIFDGQVELLGTDLGRETWPANEELRIDTYWQRVADMDRNTQVSISVVDEMGIIWSKKEGARPRGYEHPPMATFLWPGDVYVIDSQLIRLLPGTPPSEYRLMVTLFQSETGIPFVTPGPDGGVTAQFPIGTIQVENAGTPFDVDRLGIQYPTDLTVGDRRLIGYNLDREAAAPGDTVLVTLFWESNEPDPAGFSLTLDGERIQAQPDPLDRPYNPSAIRWREQYFIRIPPEAEAGRHQIGINTVEIASVEVTAIVRQFEPPAVSIPVDAMFSQSASLIGVTVNGDGEQTRVSLVWKAEADLPISYTVFVHTLDENGSLIAQSDSIPAGGTRPTTGWLVGEYVVDEHILAVPIEQAAAFRIGLYDPSTGLRLRLPDGSDSITVPLE